MRILYLHSTADLYGAARCMLRTIRRQVQEGHSIRVIIPFDGPLRHELERSGALVEIVSLDPSIRKKYLIHPIQFIRFLRSVILSVHRYSDIGRRMKTDLVHTNTSQIVPGGLVARKLKVPHICHVRESYEGFGFLWNLYREYILRFSDSIVCVSGAIAGQFPGKYLGRKVQVIHDGFPHEEFTPVSRSRVDRFIEQYGLKGKTLVGLIGRIILPKKGQQIFVEAARLNRGRLKNVKYLIIGGCYPGNEFHLTRLLGIMDRLDVNEEVLYTGEIEDIKAAISSLDVSVLATIIPEAFSGVIMESMAFGKPVIATATGGSPEQVENNKTGILVPPGAPQAMADAIAKLVSNGRLRNRMGVEGRKRFFGEFSFTNYYESLMAVYARLIRP
jgi:glycosyltransferase involved in cell wall biosynthesis